MVEVLGLGRGRAFGSSHRRLEATVGGVREGGYSNVEWEEEETSRPETSGGRGWEGVGALRVDIFTGG